LLKIFKILLFPLTALLSLLYAQIITLRHFLYDHKILPSFKPETWTISIGNITVGGTGKTPLTIEVVEDLKRHNYRPVIISRGYKRQSEGLVVVYDGKKFLTDALTGGDEPYLLALATGVPVICAEDRMQAAEMAVERFKADFIVLDDAFQHRRLRRDFDLVAVDSVRFLGNHLLLPAGILRDTVCRLAKADLLILTKTESTPAEKVQQQIQYLKRFAKKIILSKTIAKNLKNYQNNLDLTILANKKIALFCGLGLPASFFAFFPESQVQFTKEFADHHKYSSDELDALVAKSQHTQCEYLITTEKDFYNFPANWQLPANLYYLNIGTVLLSENSEKVELTPTVLNSKMYNL